jgi:hypothetical protein
METNCGKAGRSKIIGLVHLRLMVEKPIEDEFKAIAPVAFEVSA